MPTSSSISQSELFPLCAYNAVVITDCRHRCKTKMHSETAIPFCEKRNPPNHFNINGVHSKWDSISFIAEPHNATPREANGDPRWEKGELTAELKHSRLVLINQDLVLLQIRGRCLTGIFDEIAQEGMFLCASSVICSWELLSVLLSSSGTAESNQPNEIGRSWT